MDLIELHNYSIKKLRTEYLRLQEHYEAATLALNRVDLNQKEYQKECEKINKKYKKL